MPATFFYTIVIGAGPAGLACATALAKAGRSVLLLERRSRIGPKVCAGGVPASTINLLNLPESLIERRFSRQLIVSAWQRMELSAPAPMVCTVDREKLGQWMANEATAAGVSILTGVTAQRIAPDEVHTSHGAFRCQYLVGADGSSSLVRRFLKLPTARVGIGLHHQLPGEFEAMAWHLAPRHFGNGYAWIFPHRHSASIGIYSAGANLPPHRLQEKLHHFAAQCGMDLTAAPPRAARINFDYRGWRFGTIFLVGDAAGLASGLTGEGIYAALLSGQIAARTILEPAYADRRLAALLRRHRLHEQVLTMAGRNRWSCTLILETLVAALRCGLIHHTALELGG
ncbi:MAG: NAD(P)/FAD-dependent oxidoreductase [Thermodesulfobacteriota bacterium]